MTLCFISKEALCLCAMRTVATEKIKTNVRKEKKRKERRREKCSASGSCYKRKKNDSPSRDTNECREGKGYNRHVDCVMLHPRIQKWKNDLFVLTCRRRRSRPSRANYERARSCYAWGHRAPSHLETVPRRSCRRRWKHPVDLSLACPYWPGGILGTWGCKPTPFFQTPSMVTCSLRRYMCCRGDSLF